MVLFIYIDHHCPWLSRCIGAHNHKKFIILIFLTLLYLIKCMIILSLILKNIHLKNTNDFKNFDHLCTLILLTIQLLVLVFVCLIIIFQIKFILSNVTTSEYLRTDSKYLNPFNEGCINNLKQFWYNILNYNNKIKLNENSEIILRNVLVSDVFSKRKDSINTELSNSISESESNNTIDEFKNKI